MLISTCLWNSLYQDKSTLQSWSLKIMFWLNFLLRKTHMNFGRIFCNNTNAASEDVYFYTIALYSFWLWVHAVAFPKAFASCITMISSKIIASGFTKIHLKRQTLLFVIENQSSLTLMKVYNHEYFRCFTLNNMHLSWLVFPKYLPVLKELLTLFSTKHLITKIQFKSIHKKNPQNRNFSCY